MNIDKHNRSKRIRYKMDDQDLFQGIMAAFSVLMIVLIFGIVFFINPEQAIEYTAYACEDDPTPTPTSGVNPATSTVSARLGTDLIRVVLWGESRWKQFNTSGQPLGNSQSTATGMSQILKTHWEDWFSTSGNQPPGYTVCPWSDMKWNWQTNVDNGKYIINTYLPAKMKDYQTQWPSTAPSISTPNQQDLITYGYKNGVTSMRGITDLNWASTVEQSSYVQYVRNVLSSNPKPWTE